MGDVRGTGYFRVLELVADQATKQRFSAEETAWLLKGQISSDLFEAGLICRADDRSEPVIVLSPPLISGEAEFDFIGSTLRAVLSKAADSLASSRR